MSNYRRAKTPGSNYFFTLVTKNRKPWFVAQENVNYLREAFLTTMSQKPFSLNAIVVLPDHLHCILQLPQNDCDYSGRWREIKKRVSRKLDTRTNQRNERPVWQRRYWEHQIRDDQDWRNHVDYIHYNPVKHGLVTRPADWPWSSFHAAVSKGWYPKDWGSTEPMNIVLMKLE